MSLFTCQWGKKSFMCFFALLLYSFITMVINFTIWHSTRPLAPHSTPWQALSVPYTLSAELIEYLLLAVCAVVAVWIIMAVLFCESKWRIIIITALVNIEFAESGGEFLSWAEVPLHVFGLGSWRLARHCSSRDDPSVGKGSVAPAVLGPALPDLLLGQIMHTEQHICVDELGNIC